MEVSTTRSFRSLTTRRAQRLKVAATRISLLTNVVLTLSKFAVGLTSGSVSVLSEAAHSSADLIASALAFFTVGVANLPPDETHAYGHGKVESLFSLTEALLLIFAAGFIVFEAVLRLLSHSRPQQLGLGMAVMASAALINVFVSRYLFRVAAETDSEALRAEAENHQADIFAAVGVFVGLGLVVLTRHTIFDPILACIVSILILRAAIRLAVTAIGTLLDGQLPTEDTDRVKKVLDGTASVLGYHKLRTRKSGAVRFVDAHILMDDRLTFQEAHDLTEHVEDRIREQLPGTQVTLHSEPFSDELLHQKEAHIPADQDDAVGLPKR